MESVFAGYLGSRRPFTESNGNSEYYSIHETIDDGRITNLINPKASLKNSRCSEPSLEKDREWEGLHFSEHRVRTRLVAVNLVRAIKG